MTFSPDSVELKISTSLQARELIRSRIPTFLDFYSVWSEWLNLMCPDCKLKKVVEDVVIISYARMSIRNGLLNSRPRQYHNEKHIEDLIYRMMAVSEYPESKEIPQYGWSLLSMFMGAHDLRQAETPESKSLVGNNEKASYEELMRLLKEIDHSRVVTETHKQLLKLMIYGSTFGTNKDENGTVFNGNLVAYLLDQVGYFDNADKEIAFLACDIDTANVSAPLIEYAHSSIDVFKEIQDFSEFKLSAQMFFGNMQEDYFFKLQKYNSKLGRLTLNDMKIKNAPFVRKVSKEISKLDESLSNQKVIDKYLQLMKEQI